MTHLHDCDGMEDILPVFNCNFIGYVKHWMWQSTKRHVSIIRTAKAAYPL